MVLDGIDAVGKSTVCRKIFESRPVTVIGEFSESALGRVIVGIIEEMRFFKLSEDFASPLADLFCILSDTFLKYESSSNYAKIAGSSACIMDRGIFSAVAYQFSRAKEYHSIDELEALHDAVLDFSLRRNQLISKAKHINLVLSEAALVSRIEARGEDRLNSAQLWRLLEIQEWMLRLSQAYGATVIDVSELSVDEVTTRVAYELDLLIDAD